MPSISDSLRTLFMALTLPVVCTYRLLSSPFVEPEREKTWRRVISDAAFRWTVYTQSLPHLSNLMGTTQDIFTSWAKTNSVHTHIEDIGHDAKILWISNQPWGTKPERLIYYLHGGGFMLAMSEGGVAFWRYVQEQLYESHGLDVAIAILDYSTIPTAEFPTPLLQTVAALTHIISAYALPPASILVTGDSAGGNLALQLASYILHPLPSNMVSVYLPSDIKHRFAGAYLMSPWITLVPRPPSRRADNINVAVTSSSYEENANWDIVHPRTLANFGAFVLEGPSQDLIGRHLPYVDSYFAPSDWYEGIEDIYPNILITAGGRECLRNDIVSFGERLKYNITGNENNAKIEVLVDRYGVHNDPFFDFVAGEKKLGELTPKIVDWCRNVFLEKNSGGK